MKVCNLVILTATIGAIVATSPAALAVGTIIITKAVIVEKDTGREVTVGYAQASKPVSFRSTATCTCHDPQLTYTWHFDDGTTANGQNASHTYGSSGAGNRSPFLTVRCACGATGNSSWRVVDAIDGIRVDTIGDISQPSNNGRLCFNSVLDIGATALPVGVSGSDMIDWYVLVATYGISMANTASGLLPKLDPVNWPTTNDGWGSGTLFISIDGPFVAGQEGELTLTGTISYIVGNKSVKKFFAEEGYQNPGSGNPPNWYFYWKLTSAYAGNCQYDGGSANGYTAKQPPYTPYVGTQDNEIYTVPSPGDNADNQLDGIDDFGWTCRHEARHSECKNTWWPNGVFVGAEDSDYDKMPNYVENACTEAEGGPYNDHDGDTYKDDTQPNDFERYTCMTQSAWTAGSADFEDWARPGKQWQ